MTQEKILELITEFIEEHIDLIEKRSWKQFYDILDDESSYYLYHNVGMITDILMASGINPLDDSSEIYNNMFVNSNIRELVVPKHITELGVSAFFDSQLEHIELHDGIKSIPFECFDACWHLKEITIPDSVEEIGGSAFLPTTKIRCHPNATAEEWGRENNNLVELIYD